MDTPDHPRYRWTAKERGFLGETLGIGNDEVEDLCPPIKQRWIHNTLREVYIHERRFVIKRYLRFAGRGDPRRTWQREHRALLRLQGLPVPQSLGFVVDRHDQAKRVVLHIKTYVAGNQPGQMSRDELWELASLLDSIHRRCVVTLDPSLHNLVRDRDGQLHFIDLGRARVHSWRGMFFCIDLGKELCRLYRETLQLDDERFAVFMHAYRQRNAAFGLMRWLIIRSSLAAFLWRYRRKATRAPSH